MSEPTGMDWVDQFMMAQAAVAGCSLMMTFEIGNSGAFFEVVRNDPSRLPELLAMIDELAATQQELSKAITELTNTAADIVANARRNALKL